MAQGLQKLDLSEGRDRKSVLYDSDVTCLELLYGHPFLCFYVFGLVHSPERAVADLVKDLVVLVDVLDPQLDLFVWISS